MPGLLRILGFLQIVDKTVTVVNYVESEIFTLLANQTVVYGCWQLTRVLGSETKWLSLDKSRTQVPCWFASVSLVPQGSWGPWWLSTHVVGCFTGQGHWAWGLYCFFNRWKQACFEGRNIACLSELITAILEKWPMKEDLCLMFLAYPARTCRDPNGPWWLPVLTVTTQNKHTQVCWPQVFVPLEYFLMFPCF